MRLMRTVWQIFRSLLKNARWGHFNVNIVRTMHQIRAIVNVWTMKLHRIIGQNYKKSTLYKNRVNISLHLYGVKKFHSLSEFLSIPTPVEWKFTTQRVESRLVHSIFTQNMWSLHREWRQWQIEWKFTPFFRVHNAILKHVKFFNYHNGNKRVEMILKSTSDDKRSQQSAYNIKSNVMENIEIEIGSGNFTDKDCKIIVQIMITIKLKHCQDCGYSECISVA